MADETSSDFPLFGLGMVVLPTELVRLHIFEARYRTMIAECLESEGEFGIVCAGDDGLADVGCAVEITRVLERMDDGRMNILCRGTRPFTLDAEQDDLPYPAATVTFLDDEDEELDEEAAVGAQDAYATLVEEAADRHLDPDEVGRMDAYEMAGTVEFGLDAKQGLLELRSENARLKLVERLFRAATKRLDFADRAEARARSNGKVRFG